MDLRRFITLKTVVEEGSFLPSPVHGRAAAPFYRIRSGTCGDQFFQTAERQALAQAVEYEGETLLAYKMPQVLQRFKQRAPQVRLSLQSLNCYVVNASSLPTR
jgi:hypothetical protein